MSAARGDHLPKGRDAIVGVGNIVQQVVVPAFRHAAETSQLAGLPDDETLRRLGLEPDEILFHEVPADQLGVP